MSRRAWSAGEPELMDRPQPVTDALRRDLANLAGLNRHWGGQRITLEFCQRWFQPGEAYRVLDLATGSGDLPRAMIDWARPRGVRLQIEAIDQNPATLAIARENSAAYPEIRFGEGDILQLERPEPVDLVCCSLALHHFSAADATLLLRRMRDWSRRWVLAADLERTALARLGIYLITALIYRDPMTKFDGRLSARRAFSAPELRALAHVAGWPACGHRRYLPARQAIYLE